MPRQPKTSVILGKYNWILSPVYLCAGRSRRCNETGCATAPKPDDQSPQFKDIATMTRYPLLLLASLLIGGLSPALAPPLWQPLPRSCCLVGVPGGVAPAGST